MKNIYRTVFLLILNAAFLIFNCFSQQITFQKTYSGDYFDYGTSIQKTTDGGYILTGYSESFSMAGKKIYLIKVDSIGGLLWSKFFGGTVEDWGYSVQQTTDGGYIVGGRTNSFGSGNYDVYLIKTDFIGDTLWTKTYGGTGDEGGTSVQQTADGGFIICGATNSFGNIGDVYLIKTNTSGNLLWTKTYGGTGGEGGSSVQQTADEGYIISGSSAGFGAGNVDVYLIKTDSIGDILWTKTFGGILNDYGKSVHQTTDGGYIITGQTNSFGAGNYDVYLIKTDSIGDTLWTKTYGGTDWDGGNSVQTTADGGYIITGQTNSFGAGNTDIYLVKTDSIGNLLWTKTFGRSGGEGGSSVQQTTDGGYITFGFTAGFAAGIEDYYLIKTDSLGNSGCNEGNPATIVTTPSTQITSPATIITSPATIVNSPPTISNTAFPSYGTLCTNVGIPNLQSSINNLQFSPNPLITQSKLIFKNPNKEKFLFILYDITGRMTESVSTTNSEIVLTKGSKPAGVYLFNLVNEKTGERVNGKIVISN